MTKTNLHVQLLFNWGVKSHIMAHAHVAHISHHSVLKAAQRFWSEGESVFVIISEPWSDGQEEGMQAGGKGVSLYAVFSVFCH